MVESQKGSFSLVSFVALLLVIEAVSGQVLNGFLPSGSSEIEIDGIESTEFFSITENALNKRQQNNQNRFKNMMINKDNQEIISDDYVTSKDGPFFYIPRTSPVNGKKRGAILSWALPANRMRVGNSNYRQTSNFGIPNSRPAAKK